MCTVLREVNFSHPSRVRSHCNEWWLLYYYYIILLQRMWAERGKNNILLYWYPLLLLQLLCTGTNALCSYNMDIYLYTISMGNYITYDNNTSIYALIVVNFVFGFWSRSANRPRSLARARASRRKFCSKMNTLLYSSSGHSSADYTARIA